MINAFLKACPLKKGRVPQVAQASLTPDILLPQPLKHWDTGADHHAWLYLVILGRFLKQLRDRKQKRPETDLNRRDCSFQTATGRGMGRGVCER